MAILGGCKCAAHEHYSYDDGPFHDGAFWAVCIVCVCGRDENEGAVGQSGWQYGHFSSGCKYRIFFSVGQNNICLWLRDSWL